MPPTVLNHKVLCNISASALNDWAYVDGVPVYRRYKDLQAIVANNIQQPYRDFLAYVVADNNRFYWYTQAKNMPLVQLSGMEQADYNRYRELLNETLNHYRAVADKLRTSGEHFKADLITAAIHHVGKTESAIFCANDKVVATVWGCLPAQGDKGFEFVDWVISSRRSCTVTFDLGNKGTTTMSTSFHKLEGSHIEGALIPVVTAASGWTFQGWDRDPRTFVVEADVVFTARYEKAQEGPQRYNVRFFDGDGKLLDHILVEKGSWIRPEEVPGHGTTIYKWNNDPLASQVMGDTDFYAAGPLPPPAEKHRVRFIDRESLVLKELHIQHGEHLNTTLIPRKPDGSDYEWDSNPLSGPITAATDFRERRGGPGRMWTVRFLDDKDNILLTTNVPDGGQLGADNVPAIDTEHYSWQTDPLGAVIHEDTDFVCSPNRPSFWERLKLFFSGRWWKWLLAIPLLVLLILFIMWMCSPCSARPLPNPIGDKPWLNEDPRAGRGGIYNPGNPYEASPTPGDRTDLLPPEEGVLAPIGDDDPIEQQPGMPPVVANRLNVLMENEDRSVLDFVEQFKSRYPSDEYKVVYYDDVVKRVQLQVPASEREALRERLPGEFMPDFNIFVYDETLYLQSFVPTDPAWADPSTSWHLRQMGLEQAWDVTRGNPKVTIAVVDNGFSLKNREFAHRVVMPYNVWEHSCNVTARQDDHGTHVAGIALAAMNGKGSCGVAPECSFMPIQVADARGRMTVTSILDGILYALYQGADVVNISAGMTFDPHHLPDIGTQRGIEASAFKAEERLWNEVSRIAQSHNAIIVTSAGTQNLLAGMDPMKRPDNFIVVSAVDQHGALVNKASFSNYGSHSTVSAPGVNIYSTFGTNGYSFMSGTSMSSPMVAGVVALMKSVDESLTALPEIGRAHV